MGDILIKGMEMPKSCDSCRIMVFEDTNCVNELYCGCPIVFKAHPQGIDHRPDYCPLVPVLPHGDLVDRDEIIEAGKSHPTYKNSKIVKAVVDKACCLLKTATVVIPANKEE